MLEAVAKNCIFMINIREGGEGRGRSSFSANSPLSPMKDLSSGAFVCGQKRKKRVRTRQMPKHKNLSEIAKERFSLHLT